MNFRYLLPALFFVGGLGLFLLGTLKKFKIIGVRLTVVNGYEWWYIMGGVVLLIISIVLYFAKKEN